VVKLCSVLHLSGIGNRAIRGAVIAISVFDLMKLNISYVLRYALTKFGPNLNSSTYPFLAYEVFAADILCHAVTLTCGRDLEHL